MSLTDSPLFAWPDERDEAPDLGGYDAYERVADWRRDADGAREAEAEWSDFLETGAWS